MAYSDCSLFLNIYTRFNFIAIMSSLAIIIAFIKNKEKKKCEAKNSETNFLAILVCRI